MFSGSIHTHSENSLFDSVASVEQIVQRAKEMGAPAIALTDHGTLTGTWDFMDACKKAKIKGVVGVEFYVGNDGRREHLVVLPKNAIGFQAISKAVTASNHNVINGRPIANIDILTEWFGKGSIGHNNVIATSACVGGILASVYLSNEKYEEDQERLRKKMLKESDPESPLYKQLCDSFSKLEEEISVLKERKATLKVISSKKYSQRIKRAEKANDADELEKIKREQKESEDSKVELATVDKEIKAKSKKLTELGARKREAEASHKKYYAYRDEIRNIEAKKMSIDEMHIMCDRKLNEYLEIFGKDNFYIELQYHGIPEEARIMPILADLAVEMDIPVVASNDIHNIRKEDAEGRAVIYAQKYNKWSLSKTDEELYMKTDEELSEWLSEILPEFIVKEAIANIKVIFDRCDLVFESGNHYPKFNCPEGAKTHLRNLVEKGKWKVPDWNSVYEERVAYELSIIEKLGFSDYFCIVEDFLNYGRLVGKIDLKDPAFLADPYNIELLEKLAEGRVGEGIGPGRGSGAGSLVAYLCGITNINPIPLDLLFERFLNPQRVTMPDIDSDIAIDVRPFVIGYMKNKYGEKAVCQIMTRNYFLSKKAARAAGRAYASMINDGRDFYDISDDISSMIEKDEPLSQIRDMVYEKYANNPDALEIFRFATLIEGKMSNISTHAAGVVISDNDDISDRLPLIFVNDDDGGKMCCQCDKDRVESLGCIKMDALGLRNLSIVTDCERAIWNTTGERISLDGIPLDCKAVYEKIFQKGNTTSVFQFESEGMKKILREFCPEKFEDLILLNAAYRPGPMQYIPDIIAVKKGEKKPDYVIPEMGRILDATYGKPIYQEQLMAIFSDFAGFSLGEADIIRRLMSKKKTKEFLKYKDKFISGLIAHGAEPKRAESFWEELINFSLYAFNKSHSAAYSLLAYATAYLKLFYTTEYAIGSLNYPADNKFNSTLQEFLSLGITVKCPDINKAYEGFSLNSGQIIFGLSSVKGVKKMSEVVVNERQKNGAYASFVDFVKRTHAGKTIAENLVKAGAFDSLHPSRKALLNAFPDIQNYLKKIAEKKAALETETNEIKRNKLIASISSFEEKLSVAIDAITDDSQENLNNEKEVLGHFISKHPIDTIRIPVDLRRTKISDLKANKTTILAYVSDLRICRRKSDNKPFAAFFADDKSAKIECACFTDPFAEYGHLLDEGSIVILNGNKRYNKNDEGSFFSVSEIEAFIEEPQTVMISVPSSEAWENGKDKVLPYSEKTGDYLVVYVEDISQYIETGILVSKDIEFAKFEW